MNKNDLNPIFVPYDLPIEDIETKGNYQKTDLYGIPCYNISPYNLTVDKEKVNEINLDSLADNKLFWMDFNIKENKKL